jgi:hypothetical protein
MKQDASKIRNIAIIAQVECFAYKTNLRFFSSRQARTKFGRGLLFSLGFVGEDL